MQVAERTCVLYIAHLPKCICSAKAIAENTPTIIKSSGLNIAAKTGPLVLIHHVCKQQTKAEITTPCYKSKQEEMKTFEGIKFHEWHTFVKVNTHTIDGG